MVEGQDQLSEGQNSLMRRLFVKPKEGELCDEEFRQIYGTLDHFEYLRDRMPDGYEFERRASYEFANKRAGQDPALMRLKTGKAGWFCAG